VVISFHIPPDSHQGFGAISNTHPTLVMTQL
jgi:hypothetical protein